MIDHCYDVFGSYGMTLPGVVEKMSTDREIESSYLKRTPAIARELSKVGIIPRCDIIITEQ